MVNGVPNLEKYQIKLTQTAKGVWVVDKLETGNENMDDMFKDIEDMTKRTVELLEKINGGGGA